MLQGVFDDPRFVDGAGLDLVGRAAGVCGNHCLSDGKNMGGPMSTDPCLDAGLDYLKKLTPWYVRFFRWIKGNKKIVVTCPRYQSTVYPND
jgi:hypothetical protein